MKHKAAHSNIKVFVIRSPAPSRFTWDTDRPCHIRGHYGGRCLCWSLLQLTYCVGGQDDGKLTKHIFELVAEDNGQRF